MSGMDVFLVVFGIVVILLRNSLDDHLIAITSLLSDLREQGDDQR